jgi:hypothetical protein
MELDMIKPLLLDSMNLQTTSKLESIKIKVLCINFTVTFAKSVNKLNLSHNLLHSLEVSFDLTQGNSFHFYLDVGAVAAPGSRSSSVPSSTSRQGQSDHICMMKVECIHELFIRFSSD